MKTVLVTESKPIDSTGFQKILTPPSTNPLSSLGLFQQENKQSLASLRRTTARHANTNAGREHFIKKKQCT